MLSATRKLTSTIHPSNTQQIPELLKEKLTNCVSSRSQFSFCNWSTSDLDFINKWAFTVEQIIHGAPSGIDNCISVHGEHYISLLYLYNTYVFVLDYTVSIQDFPLIAVERCNTTANVFDKDVATLSYSEVYQCVAISYRRVCFIRVFCCCRYISKTKFLIL